MVFAIQVDVTVEVRGNGLSEALEIAEAYVEAAMREFDEGGHAEAWSRATGHQCGSHTVEAMSAVNGN